MFASTGFRLVAIYAALLCVTFIFAGAGAWFASRNAASDELRAQIESEAAYISGIFASEGEGAAAQAIAARLSHPTTFTYRLEAADGRVIAGEDILPPQEPGWRLVDPPDRDERPIGDYLVLTSTLASGDRLSVGDDLERSERIRNAVLQALTWTGLFSLAAALVVGLLATRRTLLRMSQLGIVAREVAAGDLSVRAPIANRRNPDDIDELTTTFNDMLERLEILVASLRRVSANVAHDLRTPLAHLSQRIEAAQRAETPDIAQDALTAAQDDIKQLLRTFEAMLRLSEIESGAMEARFAPFDFSQVVERVVDAYRPDIEASGRTLNTKLAPDVVLKGDAGLAAQLAANLLDNAIQHTPANARISVDLNLDGAAAHFIVADNGPGIPATERARLLAPFERGDASRSKPGSGLGLSIAAAVARLHHGALTLEDARPGLKVSATIPAAP